MARKKKKPTAQQPLSPKKYILTRARQLPIYKCLINDNWEESKLASVTVTRKHSNGNVTAGFFLVDMMARGVKDTHYTFNEPEEDFFNDLHDRWPNHLEEIPYPLAHNIIYGALEFADEYNFSPHRDFDVTSCVLEEDTDDIELIDLEFGVEGKPFIMEPVGPDEDFEAGLDEDFDENPGEEDPGYDTTFATFHAWSDDDWREFSKADEKPAPTVLLKAIVVLFDKWFHEHYPTSLTDHPAAISLDSIEIAYDDIDPYYFRNKEVPEETQEIAKRLSSANSQDEFDHVRTRLRTMIADNPKNPVYHNYLAICLGASGDIPEFRKTVGNMVKQFPEYPFSKMAFANVLMDEGNMEAAEKLFDNCYTLPDIYPGRRLFHINELIGFNSTMMRLFLHKDDIEAVNVYYETMSLLDDDGLMEATDLCVKVSEQFLKKKLEIVMRYAIEKGYVEED